MPTTEKTLQDRDLDDLVEHAARLAQADDELRWALIQSRREAGLSQRDVAEIMGVRQPTVATFESQDNDPRLSTLRRYALAVGADVAHQVTTRGGTPLLSEGWSAVRILSAAQWSLISDGAAGRPLPVRPGRSVPLVDQFTEAA